jgi:hypothetical protein
MSDDRTPTTGQIAKDGRAADGEPIYCGECSRAHAELDHAGVKPSSRYERNVPPVHERIRRLAARAAGRPDTEPSYTDDDAFARRDAARYEELRRMLFEDWETLGEWRNRHPSWIDNALDTSLQWIEAAETVKDARAALRSKSAGRSHGGEING